MVRSRASYLILVQVILGLATIVGLAWANQRFVRSFEVAEEFARQWALVRGYSTEGISPYDPQISDVAAELMGLPPDNKLVFAQPLYATILILPFAMISDVVAAKTAWLLIIELCMIAMTIVGVRLTQWRPGLLNWFLLVTYCLLGFPAIHALIEGDSIVFVAIFLVASLVSLRLGWDELGAIALALSTIMPEVILTTCIFILVWAISTRRFRFLIWFIFTMSVMIIVGLLFIPDWPLQYLRVVINYKELTNGWLSSFTIFTTSWPGVGRQLAWFFTIGAVVLQLVEWALARRKDFKWFIWTCSLTITVSFWTGIPTRLENIYILTIPIILILAIWDHRIPGKGHWLPVFGLISAFIGMWLLFFNKLLTGTVGSLPEVFIITIPFFVLIGLYWIRWWSVHPQRLGMDELRAYEALR